MKPVIGTDLNVLNQIAIKSIIKLNASNLCVPGFKTLVISIQLVIISRIALNAIMFLDVYIMTDSVYLIKHVHFLQRRHAQELLLQEYNVFGMMEVMMKMMY